ncbi:MAG: cytochrome b/b6 domain-containing protein [Gammaproteobacteria bacterium]|nr:cytochrome b/b6 domain-containing protein [Gammaproteobacteria bacterium]
MGDWPPSTERLDWYSVKPDDAQGAEPLYVWDAPVRLFHWLLVVLVTTSVITGLAGSQAFTWHERSGIAILALLLFRWLWGFAGSTTARFTHFVRGPRAVAAFVHALLRDRPYPVAGHNPLGGWMVVALLVALTAQAGSGLFADDEVFSSGPLADRVGNATSRVLTSFHGSNAWVVVTLACIHIAAVLFHLRVRGENLVRPMITGRRTWPRDRARPGLRFAPNWVAALVLVLSVAAVLAALAHFG